MDLTSRSLMMGSAVEPFSTTAELVTSGSQVMSTTSSSTTFTLTGIQANDVVFFSHVSDVVSSDFLLANTSDLSSWTEFVDNTLQTSAGVTPGEFAPGRSIFYKVATGTSMSVNLTYIPQADAYQYACSMVAFRGLNTSAPIVSPSLAYNSGTSVSAESRGTPTYDTYNIAWHFHDDDEDAVLGQPAGYTEILQVRSTSVDINDAGTMAISYAPVAKNTLMSSRNFTSTQSDASQVIDAFLVPSGKDGVAPIITGSSFVTAPVGGTAVATYSVPETVTWSLEGPDASLFSISSSGVVTYNSTSTLGAKDITVKAVDTSNLVSRLDVEVYAYVTGTSGGGISLVTSTSGATSTTADTTFSLTGIQSGDVVVLVGASDSGSASDLDNRASLTANGWTRETLQSYGSSTPYLPVYYKVATGTSESVTITFVTSNAERFAVSMSAWRGVDNTQPFLDFSGLATTSSGTTVTIPSFYIYSEGVAFLIAGLDDDDSSVTTGPTGYTELVDQGAGGPIGGNSATLGIFYKNVVGNTTEAQAQVVFGLSDSHEGWTYILNPD